MYAGKREMKAASSRGRQMGLTRMRMRTENLPEKKPYAALNTDIDQAVHEDSHRPRMHAPARVVGGTSVFSLCGELL